jgi:hypothetical protein
LGLFPANELDAYIAQVWSFYRTNPMTVSHACGQDGGILHNFTGQVSGNPASLVFSESGVAKFQFSMPSTLSVYQNEIGTLVSFPQGQMTELNMCLAQGVAAKLGGAFLRTNLLVNTNLDACQVSQFYKNTPIQQYAQIFHQFGIDGLAYSFGYDDTCSQSSYITVIAPTAVSVTISGTQ